MNFFELIQFPFMQNALITGSIIAIVAAIMGYFVIARGLTFAGHALAHIGFAGAAGAVLIGINPVIGLLVFTIGASVGIGALGKELEERDVTIGIIMTLALGLGILFLSLYEGYAEQAYSILFGTILGISRANVLTTAIISVLTLGCLTIIFRPLLFSSFDASVAEAHGVPVRLLSIVFLVLVAITVSISVQIVGVMLIFTLLIGPAATAMRIFLRPLWALLLATALGLTYTWGGILLAAYGNWPVSFYITTLAFGVYLPIRLLSPLWNRRRVVKTPNIANRDVQTEEYHSTSQVSAASNIAVQNSLAAGRNGKSSQANEPDQQPEGSSRR
jgi:zinc/manganese transport system permease protein